MDHIVGELLVRALDVEPFAELSGLEINVVESERPGQLVEHPLAANQQVRHVRERQMKNQITEPIGVRLRGFARRCRDLVNEVAHLGGIVALVDRHFAGECIERTATVTSAENLKVCVLIIVRLIFRGIESPPDLPRQRRELFSAFLLGEIAEIDRDSGDNDHGNDNQNEQGTVHGPTE